MAPFGGGLGDMKRRSGMLQRHACRRFVIAFGLCLLGSLGVVRGATAEASASVSGVASAVPSRVAVNTLVQLNPTGLRAIQIGSSYFDTDYVAAEVVLRRSDLSLVAKYLWDGQHAAANALNDVEHRPASDVVVIAAGPTCRAILAAAGRRSSRRSARARSVI